MSEPLESTLNQIREYARLDPAGAELTMSDDTRSADGTPQLALYVDMPGAGMIAGYWLNAEAAVALAALMLRWAAGELPEVPVPDAIAPFNPAEAVRGAVGACSLALDCMTGKASE